MTLNKAHREAMLAFAHAAIVPIDTRVKHLKRCLKEIDAAEARAKKFRQALEQSATLAGQGQYEEAREVALAALEAS